MPLAPTPVAAVPSKPKIGFSIDSIVGGNGGTSPTRSDGEQSVVSDSPVGSQRSRSPSLSPPTLVRPSALPPPSFPKSLYLHDPLVHPGHHHQLAFAAAAAQHFQAANLAAALGNGSFGQPSGAPSQGNPGGPLLNPGHHPPPPPRDTYPLYPWLLSRHGRIFPHRFPGG